MDFCLEKDTSSVHPVGGTSGCVEKQVITYASKLQLGLRIECDPTNYIDRFVLTTGIWEPLVLSVLQALVKPGDICVDVGANAGYISLVMAGLVGPTGRVHSFEPNPELWSKFKRNVELNPTVCPRVELHTVGLGKESSTMFVHPDRDEGNGNACLVSASGVTTTHAVRVESLDSYSLKRVDCIKIDVEGMELDVLKGASKTLSTSLPVVVFETLRTRSSEYHHAIAQYLREFGYGIYSLDGDQRALKPIRGTEFPQDDTFAVHPARFKISSGG